MQAAGSIEDISFDAESRLRPAQIRAIRRRAMRIHLGARSSVDILNALAARVEGNPAAVLRDVTPVEQH